MSAFKNPSFQDRQAAAGKAKQNALDGLAAKPPTDPAMLAERRRNWETRELNLTAERKAKAETAAAAKAADVLIKQTRLADEKAATELKAARLKPASAADMKAARDARYAARQTRK